MPHLLLLQFLNLLMGGGCYLVAVTSFGAWSQASWSPMATGSAMMAANLAYCLIVGVGGRLADGWGRARTAVAGAAMTGCGALLAFLCSDPVASALATVICFGGAGLFFPGNVGLFSDAGGTDGQEVPLHQKVSRYNLGWSSGNLSGFIIAWLLSLTDDGLRWGYMIAGAGCIVIMVSLVRWWSLAPRPPSASGDRSDHPALKNLIRMGRISLLIYCLLGMALIALFENTIARSVPAAQAHTTATAALALYALGYFLTFGVLGWWGGWVMHPWKLFFMTMILPVAALGFIICGVVGVTTALPFAVCAFALGVAFAAVYTSSIYYSLRLPHGAARAASLHETYLGVGSTIGPALCGGFLMLWQDGVTGLGVYLLIGAVLVLAWQLTQLPTITRLLKPVP